MLDAHDHLATLVLRHPCQAAAWLVWLLPHELATGLDMNRLAAAPGRIPGLRLQQHFADLVFTAPARDGTDVLVLIEHKSGTDPGLHDQVLRYVVHLRHQARRRGLPVPPHVVPTVLCHGGPVHLAPRAPQIEGPHGTALTACLPRITPFVHELAGHDEAAILALPLPPALRLTFLCLQHTRDLGPRELLQCLDRWQHLLRAVEVDDGPPHPHDLLDAIGWYLVDTSELTERDVAMAYDRHLHDPHSVPMTTGERIRRESRDLGRAEGRVAGRAEGKAEGKAETLLHLLTRRFGAVPPWLRTRILAADTAELDLRLDRVLDATTLADVFAS
jgi:hypothetical protein